MTELLFNKRLQVLVKNRDTDERRSVIRISIELQASSNPVHRKDLVVRLTDDSDFYFLYNLVISEEDFQSLKVQQGLLIDFTSFPQKFIDLLEQCISEQDKENPRFLLHLTSASSAFDRSPSDLNIVETNAFKHLTHLSLKLLPGSDTDIKKYLATCLSTVKEEKQQLEQKLRKTEEDLTRQLNYAQQTLSEKSRELDKLRSEWTSQTTSLSSRHMQDLTAEREKALEIQARLQQQNEQLRQELESSHHRSTQQLQTKASELETANRELIDKKYKSDSTVRDLKAKLASLEEECQRSKQQVLSLRRENSTLDTECHEKERLVNQLQTRVAVFEQEIKDKEQLVLRNLRQNRQQVTILSTVPKRKLKSYIAACSRSRCADVKRKSKREDAVQLNHSRCFHLMVCLIETFSRHFLPSCSSVITWLNKQLNENQLSRKQETLGMFETPAAGLRTGSVPHNMVIHLCH
uniref:Spindle assembly abnormal protein 6 homolog n=1 Tax=Sinocyclocheilus anshuiensis TaxID=1608454 RepID=A0A671TAS2_9TELE